MHHRMGFGPRLVFLIAVLAGGMAAAACVHAQGLFGKNKVQYDRLEWQVLRTQHVELY